MLFLKDHFLASALVPLFVVLGLFSFYKYIVQQDYLVTYEAECDPEEQVCYVGCEDESCEQTYYYAYIERYAPDLKNQCGIDITGCDAANSCMPGEETCTATYCDSSEGECETISKIPEGLQDQIIEDTEL